MYKSYVHPHPRQSLAIGGLQPRRRSLDPYGEFLTHRYRREPYELEHRTPRRHYSEPPQPSYNSAKPKTIDQATVEIVKHIDNNKDAISEDLRLERKRCARIVATDLSGVLRHSAQLFDRLFFKGALHHHVKLNLDDRKGEISADCSGKTKVAPDGTGTTVILCLPQLQAVFTKKGPRTGTDHAYATLLHQLIHAYFMVACGIQNDGKDPDGRLKHGEHFGCLMYKIKDIFLKSGDPIPLDFGHTLPMPTRRAAMGEPVRDALYHTNNYRANSKYCTECSKNVEVIKEEKITDWYKKKCIKAVDPDIFEFDFENDTVDSKPSSKCGDKKDWVEIVHSKKAYKLDRKALGFQHLKKKFEGDKRKLDIASWVDLDVFKSLMSFLIQGFWSPDLSNVQNGTKGPPLLLEYQPNAQKRVQHDIAVYQLGACLGIDDLRFKALHRLSHHHFTHESGHDIMRAIYYDAPSPVDEALRSWVREFLKRHREPKAGYSPIDLSNWKILQTDIVFQAGFFGSGSGKMKDDMDKAEIDLRRMVEEAADPYTTHICTAHCTWSNCLFQYQRVFPSQRHGSLITHPNAPPPPPPPPPATFIPLRIPLSQHQSIPTYSTTAYGPHPHIPPPASWSHVKQQRDYSWRAQDPVGQWYILERDMERWMPIFPSESSYNVRLHYDDPYIGEFCDDRY